MNKKLVFLTLLAFFLSSISSATLEVHSVEASGTIYIRTDGSIDPPTAELSSDGNITYSMTGNLSSSIVIEKDNIVFDGAGYTIQGSGSGNGIEMAGRNNVTIENVEVRGFYQGIMIYNSSRDNNVFGVRAIYNSYGGIRVDSSTNNNVTGNMVVGGNEGIILSGNGGNNSVVRNNIEGNEFYGVNLISTSNNLVESNNVSNCGAEGILLWMSSYNNVICGNKVTQCKVGIEVSYSSNSNLILQNDFSMNNWSGVNIGFRIPESGPEQGGVANNSFIENNVTDNNVGIYLIYSRNNTILRNNIQGNNASIIVYGSYFNIWDDGAIGNYWSDYLGTDANYDGIGDTPYVIDANNTDHYPLTTTNIIPEFPSFLTILLFAMATLLVVIVYRRKHVQRE
jgi:parallel beta-helix repeat protein